ncbi:hypothetical protein C0585_04135 [Candidatus Woesearchaeota archaeon]|nr:MAG: hypothetical protein C0585_04135 [Candidatus Woesearchaeota archaeon]
MNRSCYESPRSPRKNSIEYCFNTIKYDVEKTFEALNKFLQDEGDFVHSNDPLQEHFQSKDAIYHLQEYGITAHLHWRHWNPHNDGLKPPDLYIKMHGDHDQILQLEDKIKEIAKDHKNPEMKPYSRGLVGCF